MSSPLQLKNPNQNGDLVKRLCDSATLKLSAREKRKQRISNLMSIADDPSNEDERKKAEKIIDEIYS